MNQKGSFHKIFFLSIAIYNEDGEKGVTITRGCNYFLFCNPQETDNFMGREEVLEKVVST